MQLEGFALLEQGRLIAAEGKLRASLELQPRDPDVVAPLTELLFTQGRRRELRELIWRVFPYGETSQQIRWLSTVWGSHHDDRLSEMFHQAHQRLRRAVEVEPVFENRFGLAVAYLIRGRPEDLRLAQELLERCVRERPESIEASLRLAECFLEQQALVPAEQLLEQVAARNARDVEYFRLAARVAAARGHDDGALDAYRRIIEAAPADIEAHLQIGLIQKRRGDETNSQFHLDRYKWASQLVREAEALLLDLEQTPKAEGAVAKCLRLGEITAAMGRRREAEAWRRIAEELDASEAEMGL